MNKSLFVATLVAGVALGSVGANLVSDAVAGVPNHLYPERAQVVYAQFAPVVTGVRTDGDGGTIVTTALGVSACATVPSDELGADPNRCTTQPFVPPAQAMQQKYEWCATQGVRAVLRERKWLDGGAE